MPLWTILLLAPAPLHGPLPAGAVAAEAPAREDRFAALEEEYERAALEWRRAQRAARRADEPFEEPHPIEAFFPRFQALAEAGEGRALLWVGLNAEETTRKPEEVAELKRAALAGVVAEFGAEPWIEDLVKRSRQQEAWLSFDEIGGLLRRVHEVNADREVRALAGYALAQRFELRGEQGDLDRAEELYATLAQDLGDTKSGGKAAKKLDALRVRVGKLAPDFAAEDVDGNAFRLADYRGKVVVLDFWGFW